MVGKKMQEQFEEEKVFVRQILIEKYNPKLPRNLSEKDFYELCIKVDNYLHEPI